MEKDLEYLVIKAIKKLPINIRKKIENTAICIEDEPSPEQLRKLKIRNKHNLLGLYEGVPKNLWGRGFGNNLPDKITIFKNSLEKMTYNNEQELQELIKNVVWHEIAHHFGFNEREARRLGEKK